jgi:hypothetical protein
MKVRVFTIHVPKRWVIAAAVAMALLCAGACLAQDSSLYRTDSSMNGRYWKLMDEGHKVIYIVGFTEGMQLEATLNNQHSSLGLKGYIVSDFVGVIEQFYADPANIRVPIIDAWMWMQLKLTGATEEQLKSAAEGFRQVSRPKRTTK